MTALRASETKTTRGVTYRTFRGPADFPAMLAVINGSKEADGIERSDTLEDMARNYQHLTNCDPHQDAILAEVHGQVVAYGRVWWAENAKGGYIYPHFTFCLPQWRDRGVRRGLLRRNEQRLRQIAGDHTAPGPRWLESWAADTETHWAALLRDVGYKGVRWGYEMVRPSLEEIPDVPLPEGLEVRPARPEHYRPIFEAAKEAFRDSWQYSEDWFSEEAYVNWQQERNFQPHLWQIAWDGDQVAGMVRSFVDVKENQEYGRRRGYTEDICVRRPWRRRGLARALIARSFQVIKQEGMTEAALGVDTQNQNGALQLYQSMGFQVAKEHTTFQKALE
jgi:ribosomal protein S18 acetylase RimI-like enzyme